MIWNNEADLTTLNQMCKLTIAEQLGIVITAIHPDSIEGTMPVDHRTHQPMGILHGGASAVLAETLGSIASYLCLKDQSKETAVGLNITADHLRPVSSGIVKGIAKPIKIGAKIHLWSIEIHNEKGQMVCIAKLSVMVIAKKAGSSNPSG